MFTDRKIKIIIAFIFCLLLPSFSYAKPAGGLPPPVVSVMTAKMETWQTEVNEIGTLSASQGVALKPNVNGRVTAVYFRSGDYVQAGAPLLQIYPDVIKAQWLSAQAQVVLTRANYERALKLFQKHVFAQADLDNALATYQSALGTANNYKAQFDQTLLRAPFAGRLGLRQVNLGDNVTTSQTIANLEALDPLRVDFSLAEAYLNQLAVGQTVEIHSRSFPNQTFKGIVYAFDSAIDPDTRTLAVRASLPNKDQKLMPGAFVDITLITSKPLQFVTIPQTAITYADDGDYVYVVVKGLAHKVKVITGPRRDDDIAILSGIKAGDTIISAGELKVTADNTPVIAGK